MLDLRRFDWISFDCYGTLVDWETGIADAVDGVLASHGAPRSRAEILALYSDIEPKVQAAQPARRYRDVLREVMATMAAELDIQCTAPERDCLADSLPRWPVFDDAPDALRALQARHKLAVISNVDDDLFAGSAAALGVDFDAVVTAEQVGGYKPDLRNFEVAAERMDVERGRWLHVAESLYHDIGPANRLGVACVWVDRPGRGGATRPTDAVPDLVVPDLAALARMVEPG
jgi:2-haloacid dehalogenase